MPVPVTRSPAPHLPVCCCQTSEALVVQYIPDKDAPKNGVKESTGKTNTNVSSKNKQIQFIRQGGIMWVKMLLADKILSTTLCCQSHSFRLEHDNGIFDKRFYSNVFTKADKLPCVWTWGFLGISLLGNGPGHVTKISPFSVQVPSQLPNFFPLHHHHHHACSQ